MGFVLNTSLGESLLEAISSLDGAFLQSKVPDKEISFCIAFGKREPIGVPHNGYLTGLAYM